MQRRPIGRICNEPGVERLKNPHTVQLMKFCIIIYGMTTFYNVIYNSHTLIKKQTLKQTLKSSTYLLRNDQINISYITVEVILEQQWVH